LKVVCPICGEEGFLHKGSPRYFRVIHHKYEHPYFSHQYGKMQKGSRTYFSHQVTKEWAEEQIARVKAEEEEYRRRLFGNEGKP
jgi:hypothetical protein